MCVERDSSFIWVNSAVVLSDLSEVRVTDLHSALHNESVSVGVGELSVLGDDLAIGGEISGKVELEVEGEVILFSDNVIGLEGSVQILLDLGVSEVVTKS